MSTTMPAFEIGSRAGKFLRNLMHAINPRSIPHMLADADSHILPCVPKHDYAQLSSTPAYSRKEGFCLQTWNALNVKVLRVATQVDTQPESSHTISVLPLEELQSFTVFQTFLSDPKPPVLPPLKEEPDIFDHDLPFA